MLSETQRATTKLWSKIRFGNGPMLDLGQIRVRIVTYMAVINAHVTGHERGYTEDAKVVEEDCGEDGGG